MKEYSVGWGITSLCNMNCEFCYSKENRRESKDVSYDDWVKFIHQNCLNIDSINYGTGENAILDDFFKFIYYVRENYPYIKQSLTTNGYIYERVVNNRDYYNIFMRAIDEIDVSLDFAEENRHIKFRGQDKAYNWAMNTLELLKNTGKIITIVFVGCEDTLKNENIDGLFKVASKYNALLRMNIYRPVSSSDEINRRFMLSYETLNNALLYIYKKYEIVGLSDALIGNMYLDNVYIRDNTGIESIRILPNGDICPSTYLISDDYSKQYNIRHEHVLSKICFNTFEKAKIPDECININCPIKNRCRGGVYDRRILWYGTIEERDPYCPFRHGKSIPDEKFQIESKGRISVHDDYLPTLFFKNKTKGV